MITNKGKNILAKYLIGQAPAYASHIAIGCGAKPLNSQYLLDDYLYSTATELNFEMFRVPIISRGYVNENGVPKIVFTAELPTEERYQISEIGIYSGATNPSATGNDSKTIFSFSNRENWEQHGLSSVTAIPRYDTLLAKAQTNNAEMETAPAAEDVFQTTSSNPFFTNTVRVNRNENCRFLNNIIAIKGNESNLTKSTIGGKERLVVGSDSKHIHLNAVGVNLEKNAPNDLLKLAFAIVNKDSTNEAVNPDEVRIMVEFTPSDTSSEYARFDIILSNDDIYDNQPGDEAFVYPSGDVDFLTNRYFVVAREIQELHKSSGFSWNQVNTVKVYATVIKGTSLVSNKSATSSVVTLTTSTNHSFIVGNKIIVSGLGDSGRFDGTFTITEVTSNTIKYNKAGAEVSSTAVSPTVEVVSPSDNYFVCLDALRLDNVATENPIYGLTGYSPVVTTNAQPILKEINTKSFVEFRFAIGVDGAVS